MAGATLASTDTVAHSSKVEVQSDIVLTGGASGVLLTVDATDVVRIACRDTTIAFGAGAEVACLGDSRVRARRTPNGAVIDVVAAGSGVTKNGNPVSSGERLRYGDIIAMDSSATWIVDATPRGSLAYSRERNGQAVRAIMPTTPALIARRFAAQRRAAMACA
jgi:hypothetical protein